MSSKISAGLLLYRIRKNILEVLLVHMGGPYWSKRDDGWWSIPKGETPTRANQDVDNGGNSETLFETAKRECKEELGVEVEEDFIPLGEIKQKAGKVVHAWAHEWNDEIKNPLPSNTFEMEWPPKSGRMEQFPEIDQAEFFPIDIARRKMIPAQSLFLDRLIEKLEIPPDATVTQQKML